MNPKLCPVDVQMIPYNGQQTLVLHDRLGLSDRALALPMALAPLLALLDGTRSEGALRAAFELRTGLHISEAGLAELLGQLDEALLLEGPRAAEARAAALAAYRAAPYRPPALADKSYPADPEELRRIFDDLCQDAEEKAALELAEEEGEAEAEAEGPIEEIGPVRGLICPHIDYVRGGAVYASTWLRAAAAVREAEVVVLLGTDHLGSPGTLTLTRQRYATPWGPLPIAEGVVEALAGALGSEAAFAEELHHRAEHSVELAVNWLHYFAGERQVEVAPILCGSFQPYVEGGADPAQVAAYERCVAAVREATAGRRTLFVAAADLAHVGPAFGDQFPLSTADRARLITADERRLAAACTGDAAAFLDVLRQERDRQRVCGLPPIYFTLRMLGGSEGDIVAYTQCPADDAGGSLVSIAGVVFT